MKNKKPGGQPGLRPNQWKTGTDPLRHEMYRFFVQQRNQANFRGEPWDFPFEDWEDKWAGKWDKKGRQRDSLSMSRIDRDIPWSYENTALMTRNEILNIRKALDKHKKTTTPRGGGD